MFERFTERARRVVVYAQEEARELSHNYIGTEHLLLGLLREPESVAGRVLAKLEISLDAVRAQVVEIIGRGEGAQSGHIPFTPRAKKVLELSLREALQLGHNYIGTEHILLGLVREGNGVAARVLVKLGGTPDRVRGAVLELAPAGPEAGAEPSARLRPAGAGGPLAEIIRRLDSLGERLTAVERHLGIESGAAGGGGTGAGGDDPGAREGGDPGAREGGDAGAREGGDAGAREGGGEAEGGSRPASGE
jgi:ATP-dependent Clp protease ATP-binding subunit ClpC